MPASSRSGKKISNDGSALQVQMASLEVAVAQLALAEFVTGLGLQPQAAIGKGRGELVAAAVGGIISAETALQLISEGESIHGGGAPAKNGKGVHAPVPADDLHVSPPRIPVISCVTSAPYPDDPDAIACILRQPAQAGEFADAIRGIDPADPDIFVHFGGAFTHNGNVTVTVGMNFDATSGAGGPVTLNGNITATGTTGNEFIDVAGG